jgi:hypothetical protein
MKRPTVPLGRNWPAQIGNRGTVAMAHGRRRRRPILVTGGETGWGKWPRCTLEVRGSDFGWWREGKLTTERAPWWRAVGRKGTTWRTSYGGGENLLVAQREVRSTGGAHSGVGGAVLWTRRQQRILSPAPLHFRCVRAGPCLGKGWHLLRSWAERSRRHGTARQRW